MENAKHDLIYLQHIADAVAKIEHYIKTVDYSTFRSQGLLQDGVIRQLEIIGEASKKLSAAFKNKYNSLPWKDIAGMRDKLIHDYFGVDLKIVWKAATEDVPKLRLMILDIQT